MYNIRIKRKNQVIYRKVVFLMEYNSHLIIFNKKS